MPSGCGGKTLGPPILRLSKSARGQRGVAHHLRIHPEARTAREQAVVRIALHERPAARPTTAGTSRTSRSSCAAPSCATPGGPVPSPASRGAPDATAALPCVPKSSLVSTRPRPNNCSHARLTATRAVSGFSSSTSQRASPRRFGIWSSPSGRQELGHAGKDLLALVHEAAAAAHVRRRPLVGDPLAHHERRRDGERLERLLQLGDPIARRLQRRCDGAVERREILALLLGAIRRGDRQDGPQPRRDLHHALPECCSR